jgi:hypothetical protein
MSDRDAASARELLAAEVRLDPYTHMLTTMYAEAWALGYEQALRDHDLTDARLSQSHGDRVDRAIRYVIDERHEAEAKAMIAMAQVGRLIGGPKLGR